MSRLLAAVVLAPIVATTGPARLQTDAPRPAWAIVDWASGAIVQADGLDRLQKPAQPGSLVKMATLAAGVDAGLVTAATRVSCPGEARVDGEVFRCSHPRLRHALRPAEALAVSCNVWFATIGSRLPRARLDGVLALLGLPASPRGAPMALAATGLRASSSPPLAWAEALRRLLSSTAIAAEAGAMVTEGLRGAALYGTAAAFSEQGLDAAAKTGTAAGSGGATMGVVVAAWPATAPTRAMVLVGAGIAGRDAADLAARIAREDGAAARPAVPAATAPPETATTRRGQVASLPASIRVGVPRAGAIEVRDYALEDYVVRVLAGEAAPASADAALDALAVAIRTFAVVNRGRHARDGYDVCTLTHCQVLRDPYAAVQAAAGRTRGQLLLAEGGRPADVYYTASCGGRTERPSAVWPNAVDLPHLPSRLDRACGGEPRWAAEIPVQDLERTLSVAGYRGGRLRDLRVEARSSSGRAAVIGLEGLVPSTISGQDLRMVVGRALGWHLLKSTAFDVRRTGGGYRFDGRGFGHGVGLCVRGAAERARRGASAVDILREYYPGLDLVRAELPPPSLAPPPRAEPVRPALPPSPRLTVSLPSASEAERGPLASFLERALTELARAAAVPEPGSVRVVVHPSAESFRRETGEPWWSAARTTGSRIDLLPLPVLRQRGSLETTIRHELAHILTEPSLEGRPRWVKEGVAMHLAGERPPASLVDGGMPRRVRCPSDPELAQAASAAAAREAYARAAACVARAIAEGRDWRELR